MAETGERPAEWGLWETSRGPEVLARYVSDWVSDYWGAVVRTSSAPGPRAAADQKDGAEAIYDDLRGAGLQPAGKPYHQNAAVQPIRHPARVGANRWGNCLDLSLLYAGACLHEGILPLLALSQAGGAGHALVLLRPNVLTDQFDHLRRKAEAETGFSFQGSSSEGPAGVATVKGPAPGSIREAMKEGALLPVDCLEFAREPSAGFEAAVRRGTDRILEGDFQLIDVEWLQRNGHASLPFDADTDGLISLFVPVAHRDGELWDLGSRDRARRELDALYGNVALTGDSGRGKSVLARTIALQTPRGAAWFLDASGPTALMNSLASAELSEGNLEGAGLLDIERQGYAMAALARLHTTDLPWTVVLDNADGAPGDLRRWLPRPRAECRQRVLVTTTRDGWGKPEGFAQVRLGRTDDEEVLAHLAAGGEALVELIDGRPLLIDVFARAQRAFNKAGAAGLPVDSGTLRHFGHDEEAAAPRALLSALYEAEILSPRHREILGRASLLPPGHLGLAALNATDDEVVPLVALGVLRRQPPDFMMHRLFGKAIRAELEEGLDIVPVALDLCRSATATETLDRHGDREGLDRLKRALTDLEIDASERRGTEFGMALHALARLIELHGRTLDSAAIYERAEPHLAAEALAVADCYHGRARAVNQHQSDDRGKVKEAIGWARRAEELRVSILQAKGRGAALALRGLLTQKLAGFERDDVAKLRVLEEARAMLEEADELRKEHAANSDDPELARSHFNLAGIRIDLAKVQREMAEEHLERAKEVYEAVEEVRNRIYPRRPHPHIAACIHGYGIVAYYRALLVATSREEQFTLLRDARDNVIKGLQDREAFEREADEAECRKSNALLAKIALARYRLSLTTKDDDAGLAITGESVLELARRRPLK